MKVIYNNWFPFGNYTTINLFGILISKDKSLDKKEINHESIHTAQFKELACVGLLLTLALDLLIGIPFWSYFLGLSLFYIWYGIEYVIIRFYHVRQKDTYHDVSFEEEAYNNDDNLDYLNTRIPFSWLKYIKVKKSGY